MDELRKQKIKEGPLRNKIREEYKHFNPTATDAKVDAAVFRLNYEKITRQKQIKQDNDVTFKPNLE